MPITPTYAALISAETAWLRNSKTNATGAIHGYDSIQPYFGHLAAHGMVLDGDSFQAVRDWVDWHIEHMDMPDAGGVFGTIDAYAKVGEALVGEADADDSAASMFLVTCRGLAEFGDPACVTFIEDRRHHIELVGSVLVQLQQSDGLTWNNSVAKVKYLEDNVESWAGFKAIAWIATNVWGDAVAAAYWEAKATLVSAGIESVLWNGSAGRYYWSKTNAGTLSILDRKGQILSFTGAVITLVSAAQAANFSVGDVIQLDNDLNGVSPRTGTATILSIDGGAGTLTLTADLTDGVSAAANGDAIFIYQSFYPAAQSQLWPIVWGLLAPTSSRAVAIWAIFQSWFPAWESTGFGDESFPQCVVGYAAALMGERSDVLQFVERIYQDYASDHLDSTYHPGEAGWFIQTLVYLHDSE